MTDCGMLFPQANHHRDAITLPDFWEFRFDPDDIGRDAGWGNGFDDARLIAVPASWNDIFADERDYLGAGWYQVTFRHGPPWEGRIHTVRFDSVSYYADVWLNGHHLGRNVGAHLPFEFETTDALQVGDNRLVVRVDGQLDNTTVPGAPSGPNRGFGNAANSMFDMMAGMMGSYPRANFDFFPYAGIHRKVYLEHRPSSGIGTVAVDADMHGTVTMDASCIGDVDEVRISVLGEQTTGAVADGAAALTMSVPDPALWGIGQPNLHELSIEAIVGGQVVDSYLMDIGFRTVEVSGHEIHLNGESIELLGFGRHEDFPIHGRGYDPAVMIKDFSLMDWMGANSFRTSHYPYCEEQLQLADRLGVLVVSESPAVSFRFDDDDGLSVRLDQWRQDLDRLVARDRNHPSVVMWSVANEPMDFVPEAGDLITEMIDRVKALDDTRPVFVESPLSHKVESHYSSDIVALHAYPGWYGNQGQLEDGLLHLRTQLAELAEQGKPIMITEIGADTIAGHHAQPPEMFSEEYQNALVVGVMDIMEETDAFVGLQWWNLCDFKTGQGIIRPKALNHKGLFTRERRPKMAAHTVRERWTRP